MDVRKYFVSILVLLRATVTLPQYILHSITKSPCGKHKMLEEVVFYTAQYCLVALTVYLVAAKCIFYLDSPLFDKLCKQYDKDHMFSLCRLTIVDFCHSFTLLFSFSPSFTVSHINFDNLDIRLCLDQPVTLLQSTRMATINSFSVIFNIFILSTFSFPLLIEQF